MVMHHVCLWYWLRNHNSSSAYCAWRYWQLGVRVTDGWR